MKTRSIILTIVLFLSVALQGAVMAQTAPIRTLLISGGHGAHWWRGGSDAINQILTNSGMFKVDTAYTGADVSDFNPDFAPYDLVVMNYDDATWSLPVRERFEKWVAAGGGVVVLHSAVVTMADWDGWNRIIGMGGWGGRSEKDGPYLYWKNGGPFYDYTPGGAGHHGLQHESTIVHRAPEHPVLSGLPAEWRHFKDEIYTRMRGPVKDLEILATANENGIDEPIMWTVRYGKGRVFVDLLGHCGNDPELRYSTKCTGYQVTLLRGCEWAATGKVTQPVPADFPSPDAWTLRPDYKAPFHAYPAND